MVEAATTDRIVDAIRDAIREVASIERVTGTTEIRDLALSSLDILEVITIVEDRFDMDINGIQLISNGEARTVDDLAQSFIADKYTVTN